jgi:uncharacterized membrane protein
MSFELESPATVDKVRALRRFGVLDERSHARALELTTKAPAPEVWRSVVSRAALILGASLVLAGVVYFFAYNWHALPKLLKFTILESGLAGAALASLKLKDLPRQVALLFATALLGPLLAVYGQVYQTGADPWTLFFVWALLAIPFAVSARWAPIWAGIVLLFNVALQQWWEDTFYWHHGEWETLAHCALMLVAWGLFEISKVKGRWAPRLFAAATVLPVTVLGMVRIADAGKWLEAPTGEVAVVTGLVLAGGLVAMYRRARPDLFMLCLAAFVLLVFGTTLVGRLLFDNLQHFELGWLLMSGLVVSEVAFAVVCLKKARRAFALEAAP